MLSMILVAMMAGGGTADSWERIDWQGKQAHMSQSADGRYTLTGPFGQRELPPTHMHTETASPMFDGLFALAQDDLAADSVEAIRTDDFDMGKPMPCHCFETGAKWHYVWTRDLSYSIDLGLWRYDPERARNGLLFKLSPVRNPAVPEGLYPMQDTGSGGSWPISTDRVSWFLAARHLLDDPAFAANVYTALHDTLAQEREYVFDQKLGLYRGETSYLDWRQQTYPGWTQANVAFIGQSFALSTNVLHYQALQLAAQLSHSHGDEKAAAQYAQQAAALKTAINAHFWRADRGMYMSYIGGDGAPFDTYDLLGIALVITSGVADAQRASSTLSQYPVWPAGSPVIWPERSDQPIYHNRAIWPFVSAYALRAARVVNDPLRIEHELRSLMRGAALAGSNMENYELLSQSIHVDDGKLSGPVINSPRQLWSVAAYLDMVSEGVFGLQDDGSVQPKLPASLVPMLFGNRQSIALDLGDRRIELQLPKKLQGNLLVAAHRRQQGDTLMVTLKGITVPTTPLRTNAVFSAPVAPPAPTLSVEGKRWRVHTERKLAVYVNGQRIGEVNGDSYVGPSNAGICVSATEVGPQGIESLHSPSVCAPEPAAVEGDWPRSWAAPRDGRYRVSLRYQNHHNDIESGVTAAVKMLEVRCPGLPLQRTPITMPHSVGEQTSTWAIVSLKAGAACQFSLAEGFNMSDLAHFAHYTGGKGGSEGPLNDATIGDLLIAPAAD